MRITVRRLRALIREAINSGDDRDRVYGIMARSNVSQREAWAKSDGVPYRFDDKSEAEAEAKRLRDTMPNAHYWVEPIRATPGASAANVSGEKFSKDDPRGLPSWQLRALQRLLQSQGAQLDDFIVMGDQPGPIITRGDVRNKSTGVEYHFFGSEWEPVRTVRR